MGGGLSRKAPRRKCDHRIGAHVIGQQAPDYKGFHVPGLREPFKSFKLYGDVIKLSFKKISMTAVWRMK